MGEVGREVYWDKNKDVVFLDTVNWLEEDKVAHVWGGKTGIRFGRMKHVAMDFDTLMSCGIGEFLGWESIDEMLVLRPKSISVQEMEEEGRWDWGSRKMGREGYVRMFLASKKLNDVGVKFDFDFVREVLDYVEGNGKKSLEPFDP